MNGKEIFLGNPLFLTNNRTRDFKFLKDRIASRLEGWKFKLLSQAERTTLIKSVVQAILAYNVSTLRFPSSICDDLYKVVRKF
ncbi:hypothetical protein PanWU01x14_220430 [Parasponia andersonii]|uniref:Uncharacterized protein n=1 Tax=Parasponia andersonii TaxID=3476 RepID=A0A2P5BQ18_PARAD|nr:hypothetical protein PanWU01x14_220430 [Parasponia andersonii]